MDFLRKLYRFSSTWTGTIIIVLFLIFFVVQSFVIPSGSMKRTMQIGDFLFAKKFSYGTPIPTLPWLNIPLVPDFNDNGHLIEGAKPQREDIVIFLYPVDGKTHFVKRCVATGGDEIVYQDKHLYIHFLEGDEYIKERYASDKIKKFRGKLWVDNPYMEKYPGIQYAPEKGSAFDNLIHRPNNMRDVSAIYVKELGPVLYESKNGKSMNAFYKKVEKGHYYMMGDNRDNSSDSRFWGSVPYKLIIGQPWFIYMSLETESYDDAFLGKVEVNGVNKGKRVGSGTNHSRLRRICGKYDIASDECKSICNKQQYTVRWDRIGRFVDDIELEEPRY